jgi:phosphatidylserine/phosphatidylglycerophosphate/cardiolipin synthase-like enzyme
MAVKFSEIELFMGPQELGGPDDLKKTIIDFINGAERSLDIAVQELDNLEIAEAIILAKKKTFLTSSGKKRLLSVRIILEGDYLHAKKPQIDPFTPGGSLESNRNIISALYRGAIKLKTDYNSKIFHQKFIIRDGKEILTGSTNFTTTGISKNLNHIAIVRNEKVVKAYKKEYNEMLSGRFGKRSNTTIKPIETKSNGVRLKPLFAPNHSPEMEIMKQMAKAKERVDFAIFTFAQSSGIDDQMNVIVNAGIKVSGLINGDQKNQKWSASRKLESEIDIKFTKKGQKGLGKLHHKLMVIDKKIVIIGSFNYTQPANLLNDENIIVIGDIDENTAIGKTNQSTLGEFVFKEIVRIKNQFT